jgi:trk system potassium uptake protein TrkA
MPECCAWRAGMTIWLRGNDLKGNNMGRKADKQEFAVIGLGRFGTAVARELLARGHTVLGIDRSREVVQPLSDELTEALILDATDEDALRSVDIAQYDAVVVAIKEDFEDELLATLTLKNLGVKRVIGVASEERQKTILLRIGADEVVMPEHDSGERLGLRLSLPNLVDRVALGQEYTIAQLHAPQALASRSVADINFTEIYHVMLVAVKRAGKLIVPPGPDLLLYSDDLIVVIGQNDDVRRLAEVQ